MILEHLLEMEVNQSEAVNKLVKTVNEVNGQVSSLEEWLFKHNTRLGVMTHSIQTISQENANLAQQKKNHEVLQNTVEVAAGGKLYQVVVDSEKTGELLLKKGRLQRRVTIIPLNRIKHRTLPQAKVAQAQRVAPRGQVQLALMLVGYEKSVQEAIEYAGVRVAGGGAEGDIQPGDPRAHGDSGG